MQALWMKDHGLDIPILFFHCLMHAFTQNAVSIFIRDQKKLSMIIFLAELDKFFYRIIPVVNWHVFRHSYSPQDFCWNPNDYTPHISTACYNEIVATLVQKLDALSRPGWLSEPGKDGAVRCTACAHRCLIKHNSRGSV
jgi:DNA-directed RNA polymerase subunit RPC12/RpoP